MCLSQIPCNELIALSAEIGFLDIGGISDFAGRSFAHDRAHSEHIGPVGNLERCAHVLLDQKRRKTLGPQRSDRAEHEFGEERR